MREDIYMRKKRDNNRDWNKVPKPRGDEGVVGYAFVVGDLLHWGHLNFLRRCKEHCDFLIVGVYTDELTMEYKRKPIFPFWQRIDLIKSLRMVDMVIKVKAGERDQSYPMKRLFNAGWKIEYLFHGTDWKATKDPDLISAKQFIESKDGELIQPPYTKGLSTTSIIKKIIKRYLDLVVEELYKDRKL